MTFGVYTKVITNEFTAHLRCNRDFCETFETHTEHKIKAECRGTVRIAESNVE